MNPCFRFAVLVLLMLSATAAAENVLDGAQVTLPYGEVRRLLEASGARERTAPPVPYVIRSARYDVSEAGGILHGTVALDVQTFSEDPVCVPLLGAGAVLEGFEPAEIAVVRSDRGFAFLSEKRQRLTVRLAFRLEGKSSGSGTVWECGTPPAVVSVLGFENEVPGVRVEGGFPAKDGTFSLPGSEGRIKITRTAEGEKTREIVPMPPVVWEARHAMRVVSDGVYLNECEWKIRHEAAFRWRVKLEPDDRMVVCRVNGRVQAPVRIDERTLEIELSGTSGESSVAFSYTGKTAAFGPVRGAIEVKLPETDLLVEATNWKLTLPSAYEPVAIEGNCEFLPAGSPNEVVLRKELLRAEAPGVRVFYQKPDKSQKP